MDDRLSCRARDPVTRSRAAWIVVEATPETEFESYLAVVPQLGGNRTCSARSSCAGDGELFDALHNGGRSCAFYVSSILTIFKKIGSFHNMVHSTRQDLKQSGWQEVDVNRQMPRRRAGLGRRTTRRWQAAHIGFAIGDEQAVSTSYETGTPIVHHDHPNHAWSTIAGAYRVDSPGKVERVGARDRGCERTKHSGRGR